MITLYSAKYNNDYKMCDCVYSCLLKCVCVIFIQEFCLGGEACKMKQTVKSVYKYSTQQ